MTIAQMLLILAIKHFQLDYWLIPLQPHAHFNSLLFNVEIADCSN